MNFFKSLKSRLLGSVKEDLNSALSGGRLDFNSKIEDALKDLISLKTGITMDKALLFSWGMFIQYSL